MKTTRISLLAALAAAVIACNPALRADDTNPAPDAAKRERPAGGQRGEAAKERLNKLTEELKLTDAQKPKVEAVLKAQMQKRQELKDATPEERKEKGKAMREETSKKMKEILTAEQFEKFEKMPGPGGPGGRRGGPAGEKTEKPAKN